MAADNIDELFAEFNRTRPDDILTKGLRNIQEEKIPRGGSRSTADGEGMRSSLDEQTEKGKHTFFNSDDSDSGEIEIESLPKVSSMNGSTKALTELKNHGVDNGGNNSDANNRLRRLEKELQMLQQQNCQLRKKLRIVNPTRFCAGSRDGPIVQILFMNQPLSRRSRYEIECAVTKIISQEMKSSLSSKVSGPLPFRPNYVCLDDSDHTDDNYSYSNVNAFCTVIGSCQYYRSFVVDIQGWPLIEYNPSLSDGWDIPKYEQHFVKPLPCAEEEDAEERAATSTAFKKPKLVCFNCGGEHSVAACPEPRNQDRINRALRDFRDSKASTTSFGNATSRYHEDDDQAKYSHLKPGVISNKLRDALGIRPTQLPPYIYQMRTLGYPPGHLHEAQRVSTSSGLAVFDKHGCELTVAGENLEDGELNEERDKAPVVEYVAEKLIDYPGFNVPAPLGIEDECQFLQCPPIQQHQSKEVMLQQLCFESPKAGNGSSKRKRNEDDMGGRETSIKQLRTGGDSVTAVDMDLADDADDDPSSYTANSNIMDSRLSHVKLDDLPIMPPPRALLHLTADKLSRYNQLVVHEPASSDQIESAILLPSTPQSGDGSFSARILRTPSSHGSSLGFSLGTPILIDSVKATPPGSKGLPDSSRFADGMSEHIPFENLPNAAGTYDKLRDVLLRHRRTTE